MSEREARGAGASHGRDWPVGCPASLAAWLAQSTQEIGFQDSAPLLVESCGCFAVPTVPHLLLGDCSTRQRPSESAERLN